MNECVVILGHKTLQGVELIIGKTKFEIEYLGIKLKDVCSIQVEKSLNGIDAPKMQLCAYWLPFYLGKNEIMIPEQEINFSMVSINSDILNAYLDWWDNTEVNDNV